MTTSDSNPRAADSRREHFARLGQIACELDDLVLEISGGPLDDELLQLGPWAGYIATSVRALGDVLDQVEFGDEVDPVRLRDLGEQVSSAALRQAA